MLTATQENSLAEAFKSGVEIPELISRFRCSRGAINRLLIKTGLMKPYSQWQPEVVERLRVLLAQEMHTGEVIASIINKEFHTDYTREAVCGKAHRLGLSNAFKKGRPEQRVRKVHAQPIRRAQSPPMMTSVPLAPSSVDNADSLNIPLMELEQGMCRWPTGDAYCGHNALERKSYCAKHQSAGTTPARYSVYGRPINR